jgi:integrase/recombinase XerD
LPAQLTPYVERYLSHYRPTLQLTANTASGPLWPNRWGKALSPTGIWTQIRLRTEAAFGKRLWPHLFRDCAVTELVDLAPEEIGVAPDVLGHTSLATTQKHYIQAKGMAAHNRVLEIILERRRNSR